MSYYVSDTEKYMKSIFNAQTPLKRQNKRWGQTDYYFLKQTNPDYPFSDPEEIPVPNGVDPIAFQDAGHKVPSSATNSLTSDLTTDTGIDSTDTGIDSTDTDTLFSSTSSLSSLTTPTTPSDNISAPFGTMSTIGTTTSNAFQSSSLIKSTEPTGTNEPSWMKGFKTSSTLGTSGLTGSSSFGNTSSLTNDTLTGGINDTLSMSESSSLNNSSFGNSSRSDLASNSLLGTSNTSSYTSTTNPLSSSTISTTNSSPFSSSISATGLSTDNSLTTLTDEPSWYKGFGLSKTNSGLGISNNYALWNQQINPTTMSRGQNVTGTTLTQRPNNKTSFMDSFSSSLKHDLDDTMYGAKRALSGMTLGGSDWLLRQAGITDDDYLAEREAEGLKMATNAAGITAEIGGNAIGFGGALLKGLGKIGLKGVSQASTAGGIEGLAYGATSSNTFDELPENMIYGATTGITIPYAFNYVSKPIQSVWNKGIKTLPHVKNILEYESDLNNYLKTKTGYHLTNITPTKEQLMTYPPDSSFNPNSYNKIKAENVLRQQTNQQPIKIYNDYLSDLGNEQLGINHFTRSDRHPFIRTLDTTLGNPDLTFSREGRDYVIKKYKNNKTGEDFFDYIIKEKGKLFDKYPVKGRYVFGKIKKGPKQNLSLLRVRPDIFKPTSGMDGLNNNITNRNAHVKNLKKNILTEKQAIKNIWLPSNSYGFNNLSSNQLINTSINPYISNAITIPAILETTNR